MRFPCLLPSAFALLFSVPAAAPAAETESPDVRFFRDLAETQSYTLGIPVSPKLTPDGKSVLFLRSGPRNPVLRLYELNVETGQERELLTPEQILKSGEEKLTAEEMARRAAAAVTARLHDISAHPRRRARSSCSAASCT
jgi:dipeptidyl-peptidase-4